MQSNDDNVGEISFTLDAGDTEGADLRRLLGLLSNRYLEQIQGTKLTELWDALKLATFLPEEAEFGPTVTHPREGVIEFGRCFASSDADPWKWSHPSVYIGCLWRRYPANALIFPSHWVLELPCAGRQVELPENFADLLRDCGWDGGPRLPINPRAPGSQRRRLTLSVRSPVFVSVCPDDHGHPAIILSIGPSLCGMPLCLLAEDDVLLEPVENQCSGEIECFADASAVYTYDEASFLGAPVLSWTHTEPFQSDRATALCDTSFKNLGAPYLDSGSRTDLKSPTPEMLRIIAGGEDRFISALVGDRGRPVPCNHSSIAAALLRNAAVEDPELILGSMLRDYAKSASTEGLRFYESTLHRYLELLSKAPRGSKKGKKSRPADAFFEAIT